MNNGHGLQTLLLTINFLLDLLAGYYNNFRYFHPAPRHPIFFLGVEHFLFFLDLYGTILGLLLLCPLVELCYEQKDIYSSLLTYLPYFAGVDFKVKHVTIGGKKLKLAIWDTGNNLLVCLHHSQIILCWCGDILSWFSLLLNLVKCLHFFYMDILMR